MVVARGQRIPQFLDHHMLKFEQISPLLDQKFNPPTRALQCELILKFEW